MTIVQEVSGVEMVFRVGEYPQKVQTSFHWHENVELVQPLNYPMKMLVDGEELDVGVGDIVVVSEQSVHNFGIEHENTKCIICQFPLKILLHAGEKLKPVKKQITAEEIGKDPVFAEQIAGLFCVIQKEKKGRKIQAVT